MSESIIGIDIGATNIQIGVVVDSNIVDEFIFSTPSDESKERIIEIIIEGIERFSNYNFIGIGIGVPGLINEEKGIVYDLWNIASWKEVFLKDKLESHFHKPVRITNDANTFALGEKEFGEGRPFKNFVGVALGTGFGTGIIINHQLYSGNFSGAGEFGDIPYLNMTIEDYCSGKFFKREYGIEGKEVYKKALDADDEALKIFNEYGKHFGENLKLVLYVLAPEAIILGGSISKSYQFFEASMRQSLDSFPFKRITNNLKIIPSVTHNISILGAAAQLINNPNLK